MKRCILLLLISLLVILSGCSSKPSLELVKSNVAIVNDKAVSGSIGITQGDKKGQELVPTVLSYEFTIRNETTNKKTGDSTKDVEIKIVPNDKLKEISKETVGINIFEPNSYNNTGLGYGQTIDGDIFNSHKDGKITLSFDLGVPEESPNATLITPSEDKLEKLLNNATDATLIITDKDTEMARFDLSKE